MDFYRKVTAVIMKIICEKEYDAKKVLLFVMEYIEKKGLEYPLLNDAMELEISLKNINGEISPDNDKVFVIDKEKMDLVADKGKTLEYYYYNDVLTGLYNRSKYEHDIHMLEITGYTHLSCIYIDAVGLHEINNHLGHKAGDHMLCSIADKIHKYFPDSLSYRIGGDEFVVLCFENTQTTVTEKINDMKKELTKIEYEISVGIGESTDCKTLDDTINYAEKCMRQDKKEFYNNNGGLRQIRSLNYKLEKLLLEKQDASHFLDVIAPKYKGVYIVNSEKDTCRYIYVPPYFQEMLDKNQGSFSLSMRDYCYDLVKREYYDRFEKLFDYEYIEEQLKKENIVDFTYQKLDGSWIELKITIYDQDSSEIPEMLWIFLDENIR